MKFQRKVVLSAKNTVDSNEERMRRKKRKLRKKLKKSMSKYLTGESSPYKLIQNLVHIQKETNPIIRSIQAAEPEIEPPEEPDVKSLASELPPDAEVDEEVKNMLKKASILVDDDQMKEAGSGEEKVTEDGAHNTEILKDDVTTSSNKENEAVSNNNTETNSEKHDEGEDPNDHVNIITLTRNEDEHDVSKESIKNRIAESDDIIWKVKNMFANLFNDDDKKKEEEEEEKRKERNFFDNLFKDDEKKKKEEEKRKERSNEKIVDVNDECKENSVAKDEKFIEDETPNNNIIIDTNQENRVIPKDDMECDQNDEKAGKEAVCERFEDRGNVMVVQNTLTDEPVKEKAEENIAQLTQKDENESKPDQRDDDVVDDCDNSMENNNVDDNERDSPELNVEESKVRNSEDNVRRMFSLNIFDSKKEKEQRREDSVAKDDKCTEDETPNNNLVIDTNQEKEIAPNNDSMVKDDKCMEDETLNNNLILDTNQEKEIAPNNDTGTDHHNYESSDEEVVCETLEDKGNDISVVDVDTKIKKSDDIPTEKSVQEKSVENSTLLVQKDEEEIISEQRDNGIVEGNEKPTQENNNMDDNERDSPELNVESKDRDNNKYQETSNNENDNWLSFSDDSEEANAGDNEYVHIMETINENDNERDGPEEEKVEEGIIVEDKKDDDERDDSPEEETIEIVTTEVKKKKKKKWIKLRLPWKKKKKNKENSRKHSRE